MKKSTFKSGVHPKDNKGQTKNLSSCVMPLVEDYFVGVSSHIGRPAIPVVASNDEVAQGQLIAKADGFISANVHSPVSGVVVGVEKALSAQGSLVDVIHIKADGDRVSNYEPIKDLSDSNAIIDRVFEAGIIGLGGAGFPTHVKLKPQTPVDSLIINLAECEPYLTCDFRLCLENTKEVEQGILLLATALKVDNIFVGIEDNKEELYNIFKDPKIKVVPLKKKYPQGAEKMLIYACTKRKVPNKGGLPSSVGCVVQNPATAFAVYEACVKGIPLYKTMATLSGNGFENPCNVWQLAGTKHSELASFGGLKEDAKKLIAGGPMMGASISTLDIPTTKSTSGFLAFDQSEAVEFEPTNCISCGKCAKACPLNLMPMYIDFYAIAKDYKEADKYGASDCMACGSCSFVCPAKRPLVSSIKLAKENLRRGK